MKKTVLLFLLSFFYLNVSAQLQRHFFGQELGKTTKSEALKSLESKGAYLTNIGGNEVLYLSDVRFGGFSWDFVTMSFYNDVFSKILFSYGRESYANDEEREDKWLKLTMKFKEKYSIYLKRDEFEVKSFIDSMTFVAMHNVQNSISLGYADLKLENERFAKEEDEL